MKYVKDEEVEFLAPNQKNRADGNLKTFSLLNDRFNAIDFNFLVADEAQYVKKMSGS